MHNQKEVDNIGIPVLPIICENLYCLVGRGTENSTSDLLSVHN